MIPSLSSLWYSDIYHGTEIHILWLLYGKCPKYHASTICSMDTITFTKKKYFSTQKLRKKTDIFVVFFRTHPGIRHFKLSEDVLWHVVLCHGIHHKVLISSRTLRRPVLVTLFLQKQIKAQLNYIIQKPKAVGLEEEQHSLVPSLSVWSASPQWWSCSPTTSSRSPRWSPLMGPVWLYTPSVVYRNGKVN